MPSDIDKDIWRQHDHRLNDIDKRFADSARSFQQIEDQIKYMIGRIDNGLSPSVNDVRKENSEIRIAITNLDHKLEISQMKMHEKVDTSFDLLKKDIGPILEWKEKFQNIWVWSIVSGFILGMVGFGTIRLAEKLTKKQANEIPNIKTMPMKR